MCHVFELPDAMPVPQQLRPEALARPAPAKPWWAQLVRAPTAGGTGGLAALVVWASELVVRAVFWMLGIASVRLTSAAPMYDHLRPGMQQQQQQPGGAGLLSPDGRADLMRSHARMVPLHVHYQGPDALRPAGPWESPALLRTTLRVSMRLAHAAGWRPDASGDGSHGEALAASLVTDAATPAAPGTVGRRLHMSGVGDTTVGDVSLHGGAAMRDLSMDRQAMKQRQALARSLPPNYLRALADYRLAGLSAAVYFLTLALIFGWVPACGVFAATLALLFLGV
jgi:hypothetical protein